MKKESILYWLSTGLLAAMMTMSAVMYLSQNPQVMEGIAAIGIPYFFIQLLGVAKILGALALVYPRFSKMTDWAYAGFTFTLIGAAWTHIATNTASSLTGVVIAMVVLGISYRYQNENPFTNRR